MVVGHLETRKFDADAFYADSLNTQVCYLYVSLMLVQCVYMGCTYEPELWHWICNSKVLGSISFAAQVADLIPSFVLFILCT